MYRVLRFVPFFILLFAAPPVAAQSTPFDPDKWEIEAQESRVETYKGRTALYLRGGSALLKDVAFTDGVIAFAIAFPAERNFTGVVWRLQDGDDFENFYFRPHNAGLPDANQYTPVFNGLAAWQLYAGDGYGAPTAYAFDEWMQVRIVVSGQQAEVYIGDMERPALFIPELKRPLAAGRVGLLGGALAPTYFADVSITPQERPPLRGQPPPAAPAPPGSILAWEVSNAFAEADLEGKHTLAPDERAAYTWTPLRAEATGIVNLARVQGVDDEVNTVFARAVVTSDRARVARLRFGFSDRVRVYFGGRLLYGGQDEYQSRDYRFLGTIGAFDALYLPLEAGENEVWFAVSENFGGWGLLAFFDDADGLSFPSE